MKTLLITLLVLFSTSAVSSETTGVVHVGNKSVTLLGNQQDVGDKAPDFKVIDDSFNAKTLQDYKGKILLISAVPSLDTGVCSMQTKRFNDEVSKFNERVVMLSISTDLPFAQKRFCKTEKIEHIKVLSDSVWRDFGMQYGLLIKDMGLLARAIFIIDSDGTIAYKEVVSELSNHPDYSAALSTLAAMSSDGQKSALSQK
ncbi:thiol peroxidase [Thalassotalea agarivorans]|uniref:Thiol peroxidase (Atypical 2-Cys peroxiredoxin) n=1 Tax=Thalassotalea agarivorans TaxID=349064 RepID=A0A1I0FCQ9_THASX|nr:thiol peroxidase [Thalassotalea agarivorans]SET55719.1 thiol peroxidase (atypical 2-Cys peroxiredoxin) [Thalassotalea agarivorans]